MKKLTHHSTRTIKRLIVLAFAAPGAMIASSTSASAQIIGAQFVTNQGNGTANASYTGTGVLGESFVVDTLGQNGNGAGVLSQNGSPNPTTLALGSSGVSLTVQASNGQSYMDERGATQTTNLYENAIEARGNATLTFTLSGLTAGDPYNVVLYGGNFGPAGGDHNPIGLTINGVATTGISGSSNVSPTFTAGVNYYEGLNVAANGLGDIVLVGATSNQYTPFSGVSIQAQVVPEPSTLATMLVGVGALAGFQAFRRRNA